MTTWSQAPAWARWGTWATLALAGLAVYGVGWAAGWSLESGHAVPLGSALVSGGNLALALVSAPAAVVWGIVTARTWRSLRDAPMRLVPVVVWAVLVAGMLRGAYYGAARALDASVLSLWDLWGIIAASRLLEAVVPVLALWPALLAMGCSHAVAGRWVALAAAIGVAGYAGLVVVLV